jgi:hypothetical protein
MSQESLYFWILVVGGATIGAALILILHGLGVTAV